MDVYDLSTVYDNNQVIIQSPTNPKLIYSYSGVGHVHDAFVRNDTAFLNCGYDGLRVMDFSMVDSIGDQPVLLGSLTSYPDAGYNHSGWLSDDGTIYIMQDENHGYDVKILDVSDLNNINILSTFNSGIDPNSMAHNGIIKDNIAYIPYYHDGLRVFDISDPSNPIQIWEYDTYLPNDHISYKGAWGVYPYLPSGNIIVSDMQSGLYILKLSNSTNILEEDHNMLIYPNPIKDYFVIKSNADNITLYNSLGSVVRNEKLNDYKNIILTEELKEGIYFYLLSKDGKRTNSGKILIN
jgi:hypothetical protein